MIIRRVSISVEAFQEIPEPERAVLVALAHASNETSILNSLLIISSRFEDDQMQVAYAQAIQMYSLARILAGKLHETWIAVESGYFRSQLSKKYHNQLDDKSIESLKALKKYFSRRNLISDIGNGLAFHFSLKSASILPRDEINGDDLSFYVGPSRGNSLYVFSETVMNTTLMELTDSATMAEAFAKFIGEINFVDRHLTIFAENWIYFLLTSKIGEKVLRSSEEEIDIGEVPLYENLAIPFFFDVA
jgi:hypothetical protein